MKIVVIGCKGMLGSDLLAELSKTENEIVGLDVGEINITKREEMDKLESYQPDIIINCAAYTQVDLAEEEREKCYLVNVTGVENLVHFVKDRDIIFVQISTDYVFDGSKKGYDENDEKNPINYYGKTKAEGEDVVTQNLDKYYIVRTSWLFGKNGKNFVNTISKLCGIKDSIDVVDDQIGSPTYTKDLSIGIIELFTGNNGYGIYHLTNSGVCSWFDFASEISRMNGCNCKVKAIKTEQYPTPAKRPRFSVLNNNKLEKLRSWQDALASYMEEIK